MDFFRLYSGSLVSTLSPIDAITVLNKDLLILNWKYPKHTYFPKTRCIDFLNLDAYYLQKYTKYDLTFHQNMFIINKFETKLYKSKS